jgi:hypothetical protein
MIRPTLLSQHKRLQHTACRECVRIMCIRFLLQDVHRFKLSLFSDMSNRLSCGHRYVINLLEWWKVMEWLIEIFGFKLFLV